MRSMILAALVAVGAAVPASAVPYNVLWLDLTPEYGGQAPDALRKQMSDYLTDYSGGSLFNSTYVSGFAGSLASEVGSNSYDVVIVDATSGGGYVNADDATALRSFYAAGNDNLLFDGTLYIRNINYNADSIFPGTNGGLGGLLINEVYSLAARGGGIFFGTDHNCCQGDVNGLINSLLPGAAFSGITYPSTDGQFNGTELLTAKVNVAPLDVLTNWAGVPSEAIAPTGTFTDFLGASRTLSSQVDVADAPGGGTKYSYISTSFAPGGGPIDIGDPDPPGGTVPEPATWAMMVIGFGLVGVTSRRRVRGAVAA